MSQNKEKIQERKQQLMELTLGFSEQYLNEEYDEVIEKLINKMARKREVPFVRGKMEIWAAAVIHAVGTVNFLFDRSNQPYVNLQTILEYFGTKQSTTSQKSKTIQDMFKMSYFDNEFSITSVKQDNPFNNMAMIDGYIIPK